MKRWLFGLGVLLLAALAVSLRLAVPYADQKLSDEALSGKVLSAMTAHGFQLGATVQDRYRAAAILTFFHAGCGGPITVAPLEVAQIEGQDEGAPAGYMQRFVFDDWQAPRLERSSVLLRQVRRALLSALKQRTSLNMDKVLKITAPAACREAWSIPWGQLWRDRSG